MVEAKTQIIWGKVGAWLGQGWGTGHGWGKVGARTLGARFGHGWARDKVGARLGQER